MKNLWLRFCKSKFAFIYSAIFFGLSVFSLGAYPLSLFVVLALLILSEPTLAEQLFGCLLIFHAVTSIFILIQNKSFKGL